MRAKRGTEPGIHKQLAIYQTGGYNFRPMKRLEWKNQIPAFHLWTYSYLLKCDDERSWQVNSKQSL